MELMKNNYQDIIKQINQAKDNTELIDIYQNYIQNDSKISLLDKKLNTLFYKI
jgi:hypothetical protein